jgi:hypothetical protein
LAVATLAGCASRPASEPQRIVVPEIVTVPVREYVPVPAELTRACPETRAEQRTVEAVVHAYNANVLALRQCNRQLRLIRALEADQP